MCACNSIPFLSMCVCVCVCVLRVRLGSDIPSLPEIMFLYTFVYMHYPLTLCVFVLFHAPVSPVYLYYIFTNVKFDAKLTLSLCVFVCVRVCVVSGSGVRVTLTFSTAAFLDNLVALATPVTHITYSVAAIDGKTHKVTGV